MRTVSVYDVRPQRSKGFFFNASPMTLHGMISNNENQFVTSGFNARNLPASRKYRVQHNRAMFAQSSYSSNAKNQKQKV